MFIISCKTVNVLPTRTPIKNVDLEALVQKIKGNYQEIFSRLTKNKGDSLLITFR